jgi:hypothetical protein
MIGNLELGGVSNSPAARAVELGANFVPEAVIATLATAGNSLERQCLIPTRL